MKASGLTGTLFHGEGVTLCRALHIRCEAFVLVKEEASAHPIHQSDTAKINKITLKADIAPARANSDQTSVVVDRNWDSLRLIRTTAENLMRCIEAGVTSTTKKPMDYQESVATGTLIYFLMNISLVSDIPLLLEIADQIPKSRKFFEMNLHCRPIEQEGWPLTSMIQWLVFGKTGHQHCPMAVDSSGFASQRAHTGFHG